MMALIAVSLKFHDVAKMWWRRKGLHMSFPRPSVHLFITHQSPSLLHLWPGSTHSYDDIPSQALLEHLRLIVARPRQVDLLFRRCRQDDGLFIGGGAIASTFRIHRARFRLDIDKCEMGRSWGRFGCEGKFSGVEHASICSLR